MIRLDDLLDKVANWLDTDSKYKNFLMCKATDITIINEPTQLATTVGEISNITMHGGSTKCITRTSWANGTRQELFEDIKTIAIKHKQPITRNVFKHELKDKYPKLSDQSLTNTLRIAVKSGYLKRTDVVRTDGRCYKSNKYIANIE